MIARLPLILMLGSAGPAAAEPTMQLWWWTPRGLQSYGNVTTGSPFTLMVSIRSENHDVSGVEFRYEGPEVLYPSIFRLSLEYSHHQVLDLDTDDPSLYRLDLSGCANPCELRELMRVRYGDFSGVLADTTDIVLTLTGPDETSQDPRFTDCAGITVSAPMGGSDGGTSGSGVSFPDGSVMLNPTPEKVLRLSRQALPECDAVVSVGDGTMSVLKSRFVD